MNKKTLLTTLILSGFIILMSCAKQDDKYLLNQRIEKLAESIEERSVKDVREYISSDFLASDNLSNDKFLMFMHYHFKRNKNISITFLKKEVRLYDNKADVIADVLLLGAGAWLPERGKAYSVESRWIKEEGDWVMSRLRWTPK